MGVVTGGGGGLPDPITTPVSIEVADDAGSLADLHVKLPAVPTAPGLLIETHAGSSLLQVNRPGTTGLVVNPNGASNPRLTFDSTGALSVKDSTGREYLAYASSRLDLDPDNGQVSVHSGYLMLAASSEPADAELLFNGCFILYVDGNNLNAKAKIGGSIVHATLGVFV